MYALRRGCPTGALRGDYTIDATRCISDLTQRTDAIPRALRPLVGDWVWGCDLCQDACPPTRRAPRDAAAFAPLDARDAGARLAGAVAPASGEFKRRTRARRWAGAAQRCCVATPRSRWATRSTAPTFRRSSRRCRGSASAGARSRRLGARSHRLPARARRAARAPGASANRPRRSRIEMRNGRCYCILSKLTVRVAATHDGARSRFRIVALAARPGARARAPAGRRRRRTPPTCMPACRSQRRPEIRTRPTSTSTSRCTASAVYQPVARRKGLLRAARQERAIDLQHGPGRWRSQFKKVYPQLEPPAEWPRDLRRDAGFRRRHDGPVPARRKKNGRIDHVDVTVDDKTATVTSMTYVYKDGGPISFQQTYAGRRRQLRGPESRPARSSCRSTRRTSPRRSATTSSTSPSTSGSSRPD